MAIVSAPHHDRQTPHRTKLQMAAFITLLILAAIGVVLLARDVLPGSSSSSGVQGSGVAATSTRALANFSSIDLAGSNNVTVVAGARQSVVVHADNNLLSHVTTQVKAGTLIIGDVGSFARQEPYVRGGQRAVTDGAGPQRQRKHHGDRHQGIAADRNPSRQR